MEDSRRLAALPPIFVISLVRAAERRADISRRLDAAGFAHQIIDGIDGTKPEVLSEVPHVLNDRLHRHTRGRALSGGEIGCYLSHYHLWQKIAAEDISCALIFEDDARWDDDFAETVADIMAAKQTWDMCLLTTDKGKSPFRKLHPVGNNRWLGYPLKRTMALSGYLIKKEAAANLCACLKVIREPVDIALCRHWEWQGVRLSVRPHVVGHDEHETTMHNKNAPPSPSLGKRRFYHLIYGGLYKTGEWLRRIYYYYAQKPGA